MLIKKSVSQLCRVVCAEYLGKKFCRSDIISLSCYNFKFLKLAEHLKPKFFLQVYLTGGICELCKKNFPTLYVYKIYAF